MATRTVVVERVIRASPERVWEALTDLQGTERVLSGVERIEVLTEGGFAVGTRWRETRRMLGKEATEEMYVTASEPPERFVVEADSQGAHYVTEFALLTAGPEATTVRMTFSAVPPGGFRGLLAKLLGGLGVRAVSRAIAKDLDDVAAAVESRSGQ
ncbi:SRPBCC family protein [Streptomyces sp. NBC_00191]|uniref:SRPBCC family protein n=1 Tax=Streptomyces sp. NBC_00191 TaxID=2975674 RepID=UPI0032468AFD